MNYRKLVQIINSKPELWDRCNAVFREPKLKEKVWLDVAAEMGESVTYCKDTFKHLREKYLREREKSKMLKDKYKPWELLPYLTFLDDQIIPRKGQQYAQYFHTNSEQSINSGDLTFQTNEVSRAYQEEKPTEDNEEIFNYSLKTTQNSEDYTVSQNDLDKSLVELVQQSYPLWDWRNNFSNKQTRDEMWLAIARKLNKTPSECIFRWKALREKYIREKSKNKMGKFKWELLEPMSFLDKVIQYRKYSKNDSEGPYQMNMDNKEGPFHGDFLFSGESSASNNDYHFQVIGEEHSLPSADFVEVKQERSDVPDSSYDLEPAPKKRRSSVTQPREEKTPEQLFGELVASLLARKSETDRQLAMVEIMKVLAK